MCIHIKTWESFNQHFSSSECSAHKEPKKHNKHNKQLELYSGIANAKMEFNERAKNKNG